jgi:hypothetical protein
MLEAIAANPTLSLIALGVAALIGKEMWATITKAHRKDEDLVAKSFFEVKSAIADVGAEVRGLGQRLASHDTGRAVLERDVAYCKAEVDLNRERYHELAQQVTLLRGLVETKRTASGEHRVPT